MRLPSALRLCEIECAGLEFPSNRSETPISILADWKSTMSRNSHNPGFEETLATLRAHSFEVAEQTEASGSVLVTKYGAGAILEPAAEKDAPPRFVVAPGALIGGQVARLVDRGFQKFLKVSNLELPATAGQLQAIHMFSEELKLLIGAADLYNEALGTTSDLYQYDRLKGREAASPPFDAAGGH